MGLAASQARFLAITARKMNCEFESMQIAQQKLSVTRDQQKAAQEYQDSMNATKLVWDADNNADGTGDTYNLSYDLMMTPSALNEYDAFLVTDTQGRVVLSESMFKAAKEGGVIDDNGNPLPKKTIETADGKTKETGQYTENGRNEFLKALGARGNIDGSTIAGITSLKNSYTQVGVGGDISDKKIANAMNSPTFINHLKEATVEKEDSNSNIQKLTKGTSLKYPIIYEAAEEGHEAGTIKNAKGSELAADTNVVLNTYEAGEKVGLAIKGYPVGGMTAKAPFTGKNSSGEEVKVKQGDTIPEGTLIDLDKGDIAPVDISVYVPTNSVKKEIGDLKYAMNFNNIDGKTYKQADTPKEANNVRITKNGQSLSTDAMKQLTLGDILDGKCELTFKGSEDNFEKLATGVLEEMASLLGYNASSTEFKGLNVDNESSQALSQAFEMTKAQLQNPSKGSGNFSALAQSAQSRNDAIYDGSTYSFSLTNILKSFLTNYAAVIDGFKSGYTVDKTSTKKSVYVTDDLNYTFIVENNEAKTDTNELNADFYNQLYNALCMYGASTDTMKQQQIQDSKYLNNALKNGQLFVMSLNTDGYFYQGHYTASDHIAEISDDEAIAQAEAEYNIKKSKLSYKEQTLELKMKNIDTELSSLNTEYDTVKNLISKNVEKVFSMFSS